jgi:GGDEF domain-containing protein/predicted TPR repeat methyltransferase
MKEYFERHRARLEVEDIHKYARILIDDLASALDGYELVIKLLDAPEREAELTEPVKTALARNRIHLEEGTLKLSIPICYRKERLAVISAVPTPGRNLPGAALPLLNTLVRLSLEKILLYKINITDRETGLNNDYYFRTYLKKNLEDPSRSSKGALKPLRLGDADDHIGLTVLLAEIANLDKLTANHGRLEAVRALKTVASWLKESASGPVCLARLDRGRLGLAMLQDDQKAARELAEKVSARLEAADRTDPLPLRLVFGLTSLPHDFADDPPRTEENGDGRDDLAGQMLERAETALREALNSKTTVLMSYGDVLQQGGRIVQTMPYNRVVVNLGRTVGAREGQVFILNDARPNLDVEYKGEVVLFDVQQDFALGEVINLRSSLSRAQPGDTLVFSRRSLRETQVGQMVSETSLDPLLGIPDHQGLMARLARIMDDVEQFALILIRVDGYDRYRTTMGHLESDAQFKNLYDLLSGSLPAGCLMGRFSAESLCVYTPDLGEQAAGELARTWRDQAARRLRQTSTFGVAVYPCGPFSRMEIMGNAQKALEHATFMGPSSVAVFDSVSLNISGDKRFEAGDRAGAVEEYLRALELNPRDLNVLNSLGVCYGYQDRSELALETFSRVLELDPNNLMALFNKGYIMAMAGDPGSALGSFRQAAETDGVNFDVLFQLGKTALELDLVEEALAAFRKAAVLKDRQPTVFRYLGQTLLKAEKKEQAMDAFKAAIRHDPEDAPSMSQLGMLFIEAGTNLDVALSLIRQSVELDVNNSLFRRRLAGALAVSGDSAGAEAEYLRAIEMGARSREVYYELGRIVQDSGRPEEARGWFQEALKQDQEFTAAQEALARLG